MRGRDASWAGMGRDASWAGMGRDASWAGMGRDASWAGMGRDASWAGMGRDASWAGMGRDGPGACIVRGVGCSTHGHGLRWSIVIYCTSWQPLGHLLPGRGVPSSKKVAGDAAWRQSDIQQRTAGGWELI